MFLPSADAYLIRSHMAGLLNLFIPLVDIEPETDGTQFWPGSHLDEAAADRAPVLTEDAAVMARMVSPGCAAGGLLCFDYRCIHRGLANANRERAVAYIVIAMTPDAVDGHNFPPLSVWDASPDATADMPFWDDAEGRVVRVVRMRREAGIQKLANSAHVSVAEARAVVRRYCALNGLDGSYQMEASVAEALCRDQDARAPYL